MVQKIREINSASRDSRRLLRKRWFPGGLKRMSKIRIQGKREKGEQCEYKGVKNWFEAAGTWKGWWNPEPEGKPGLDKEALTLYLVEILLNLLTQIVQLLCAKNWDTVINKTINDLALLQLLFQREREWTSEQIYITQIMPFYYKIINM